MNFSRFSQSWRGINRENTIHRVTTPGLIVCLMIALSGWLSKDRVTVLVPPNLSEATSVSKRTADAGYKKAWAVTVAGLLGNISPGNADFAMESLQVLMAPAVFQQLQKAVAGEVATIKSDGVSISFEQRSVQYERETDKVFVVGRSGISGPAGPVSKFDRVYEMQVAVDNGHPQITNLSTYTGVPRTLEYVKAHPAKAASGVSE